MKRCVTGPPLFHESHYLLGTAAGPHPFPTIVREFHRVISEEAKAQMLERTGGLPDVVTACVGGGSNAIGMFAEFIDEPSVELVGVEPAGEGLDSGKHGAPIYEGHIGILHGARSYLMRTSDGQVEESLFHFRWSGLSGRRSSARPPARNRARAVRGHHRCGGT